MSIPATPPTFNSPDDCIVLVRPPADATDEWLVERGVKRKYLPEALQYLWFDRETTALVFPTFREPHEALLAAWGRSAGSGVEVRPSGAGTGHFEVDLSGWFRLPHLRLSKSRADSYTFRPAAPACAPFIEL